MYNPIKTAGESLTVAGTALGFTTVPAGVVKARCQVLTANIRMYTDGSTPTSSAGYQLIPGQWFELFGNQEIVNCLMIREGSTSAVVVIQYYVGSPDQWDN